MLLNEQLVLFYEERGETGAQRSRHREDERARRSTETVKSTELERKKGRHTAWLEKKKKETRTSVVNELTEHRVRGEVPTMEATTLVDKGPIGTACTGGGGGGGGGGECGGAKSHILRRKKSAMSGGGAKESLVGDSSSDANGERQEGREQTRKDRRGLLVRLRNQSRSGQRGMKKKKVISRGEDGKTTCADSDAGEPMGRKKKIIERKGVNHNASYRGSVIMTARGLRGEVKARGSESQRDGKMRFQCIFLWPKLQHRGVFRRDKQGCSIRRFQSIARGKKRT